MAASSEEIFSDYAYFSSYSDSWLQHAESYVEAMIERFRFGPRSQVIEIASNVARAAEEIGIKLGSPQGGWPRA